MGRCLDSFSRHREQLDSKYTWILTLRDDSDVPMQFDATIEFKDADGFIVDTDDARDLSVPPRSQREFSGFDLVTGSVAGSAAKTSVSVKSSS